MMFFNLYKFEKQIGTDGTIKWLIKLKDNSEVETVYIPE